MSRDLLASALRALQRLAQVAGTQLVDVRLVVQDRAGAERLHDAVRDPEAQRPSVASDVVSSQEAIQMWETGDDLREAEGLEDTIGGVRWTIEWRD